MHIPIWESLQYEWMDEQLNRWKNGWSGRGGYVGTVTCINTDVNVDIDM